MKLVLILAIVTIASAFIGDNNVSRPVLVQDIDRKIDSFRIQTDINQRLFKIKINKIKS